MRILTFDIGGTFIKYGICEDFILSEKNKVPTEAQNGGNAIIEKVISIIKTFDNIDRIAISTAGQVDSESGTIVYSTGNIPSYTGTEIKKLIENETGIPTYVENDVNSAAIGEAKFGAAKGYDSFICLTYGTGIGGAIYINDQVFKGTGSSAGELGHIITHANGKGCTCGGNGCYEAYASTTALTKSVSEAIGRKINAVEIFDESNFSISTIKAEIDKWIDEIIFGLITIIYTFNPPLIVLGGGIMNEGYITNAINERIYSMLMDSFRNVKIVSAELGNNAGMLGASYMASNI